MMQIGDWIAVEEIQDESTFNKIVEAVGANPTSSLWPPCEDTCGLQYTSKSTLQWVSVRYCNPLNRLPLKMLLTPPMPSKYHRAVTGLQFKNGKWGKAPPVVIDIYDLLQAYRDTIDNPALEHLIKKALCAGHRGHKDRKQDFKDMLDSLKRAAQLEGIDYGR